MPNDSLYPANPQAQEFFRYFAHHWDFIIAPAGTKDWQTITNYKLQPRILWHKFQDPQNILGVRFGKLTKYCMVDIDRGSWLHFMNNPQAFRDLCQAFELIGLCRFVILFSSFSEGVHIYFPLTEEVNTFNLACALRMAVENAGFKIKGGQLELFPNTKTYKKNQNGNEFSHFNGHRLPLQPETGSVLLDDDLNPYSQDLGAFFAHMDWAASGQDMEKLKDTLSLARDWYSKRQYRFAQTSNSSKIKQWQEDTEALIKEGFTDYGQTNELIREIGKYGRVFLALESRELQQYMAETITNLPEYKKYCRHQTEIEQRCHHWAKIIEPFWWPLGTTPTRYTSYQEMNERGQQTVKNSQLNQERTTECQERLKQTLEHLIQQAVTLPKKVGERLKLLCQTSKKLFGKAFSERTLKKLAYLPLWHPKFDKERPEPENSPEQEPETEVITTTTIENTTPAPISEVQNDSSSSSHPKEETILQKPIQPETISDKQSPEKITPPDVVRKNQPKIKRPERIPDGQYREKDHTLPLMKGCGPDAEFLDLAASVERSETASSENDHQQNQKKEKPKKNNQESNSENITKTNGQKIPQNSLKLDKKTLSESQRSYYQEILNRHPDLKALDNERQQPEYQKRMKNLFAEVKEILRRKSQSRRSGLNNQNE
ncbi:MAG: hypothetical protein AAGA80_06405 [Cyanobacteria bacterium P01_F01_bin.143]